MSKLQTLLAALMLLPLVHGDINISHTKKIEAPDLHLNSNESTVNIDRLKQSDWYTSIMENMKQNEYAFNWQEEIKSWSSPNRKNNLRFSYNGNGFRAKPRVTKVPVGDYDATKLPSDINYKTLPDWEAAFTLDKTQVGVYFLHLQSGKEVQVLQFVKE